MYYVRILYATCSINNAYCCVRVSSMYMYSTRTHWSPWTAVEEGDIASLFVRGLQSRTGACSENVSPPTTELQKRQQWPGGFIGKRQFFFFHFFLNEPIAGTPRHVCKQLHAKTRRSDCVGPISSHLYTTPKVVINTWYYVTTQITHVLRTEV